MCVCVLKSTFTIKYREALSSIALHQKSKLEHKIVFNV